MEFEHSEKVRALQARVEAFMVEHIYPNEEELFAEVNEGDRWQPVRLLETLKAEARTAGLWNLFLPESAYGAGLTNLDMRRFAKSWAALPGRPRRSTAQHPTPAIWKSWYATAPRSSASVGSSPCSRARSAPLSQ